MAPWPQKKGPTTPSKNAPRKAPNSAQQTDSWNMIGTARPRLPPRGTQKKPKRLSGRPRGRHPW
eukprot:633667-Pyramimonas_sp.AAC.1